MKRAREMMKHGVKRQRGFTLIELLIVIGILAIVAAVAIPNLVRFSGRGKGESYDSDKTSLLTLCSSYNTEYGCYPTKSGSGADGNPDSARIVFRGYVGNNGARFTSSALVSAAPQTANAVVIPHQTVLMVGNLVKVGAANAVVVSNIVAGATSDTVYFKDGLSAAVTTTDTIMTQPQGLVDVGLLDAAPKSASSNNPGGISGSYTWCLTATWSISTDPAKNPKVYP